MGAGGSERCNDQVALEVEPEAGGARALPVPEETASASALRQNRLLFGELHPAGRPVRLEWKEQGGLRVGCESR